VSIINKKNGAGAVLLWVIFGAQAETGPVSQDQTGTPPLEAGQSLKSLPPEFRAIIREMEGTEFEEQLLQNFSPAGMDDPKVREVVISYYLSRKNYEAARFWLMRAQKAGQPTPASQRLAIALVDDEEETVAEILDKESDSLSPADRVQALNYLNRTDQALKTLDNYLQTSEGFGQMGFYSNYRNAMVVQQSTEVTPGWNFSQLGGLDITQSHVRIAMPVLKSPLVFHFKHNYLQTSTPDLVLPADHEYDASLEGRFPLHVNHQLQAKLGGNQQDWESLVYGAIGLQSTLASYLTSYLRVGVHEISNESAFFRALGAKDTLSLLLTNQLTSQTLFQVELDGHRYLTRQESLLGEGYKVSAILSHTLLPSMPAWQIRLQGSWEANSLEDNLPAELRAPLPSPFAKVDLIVPDYYGTIGFGSTFRYGLSEPEIPREPYLLLDGWVGWATPSNELAYNGRVGLGVSLFKADVLSVGAFYGNVQGGFADQAYQGVGAEYTMRF
jgi:hypothetical protein